MATRNAKAPVKAGFIEAMECLPVTTVPDGPDWTYEIKLDGYRLQAVKTGGKITLFSRRHNELNQRFPYIVTALEEMPDETVIDGELVAIGPDGKPNFNRLQNFKSAQADIVYYAFDILVLKGKDLMEQPLWQRRFLLSKILKSGKHVELSQVPNFTAAKMLSFAKEHGLEGVIAKRADSVYEPGIRTGLWVKHRINLGQEFIIGGYVPSNLGLDSLVVGFYDGKNLMYAARVRAGFVPATRRKVFEEIKHLKTAKCAFVNLPEKEAGRWGAGFTPEKMKECVWLKPEKVAQIEFLEWTGANHLRHTKFVGMRDDKDPRKVVRET